MTSDSFSQKIQLANKFPSLSMTWLIKIIYNILLQLYWYCLYRLKKDESNFENFNFEKKVIKKLIFIICFNLHVLILEFTNFKTIIGQTSNCFCT